MKRTTKLFCVYDNVAQTIYTVGLATTAGAFVRDIGKMLYRANSNFETEFLLYEICEFDEGTRETVSDLSWKLISWDVYKNPEVPAIKMDNLDMKGGENIG